MYRKHIAILAACSLAALFASSSALAHDCDTPTARSHGHKQAVAKVHKVKRVVKASTRAPVAKKHKPVRTVSYAGPKRQAVKHGCAPVQDSGQAECVCPEQGVSTAALLSTGEWERIR